MSRILDAYLAARGITSADAPLTPEQQQMVMADRVKLLQILERHNRTQLTTFSDERRAFLTEAVKYNDSLLKSRDRILETRGKDQRTALEVLQRERDSIRRNATALATSRSAVDNAVFNQMEQAYNSPLPSQDGAAAAWDVLAGYFDQGISLGDPQLLATIKAFATDQRFANFLDWDRFESGDLNGALPSNIEGIVRSKALNELKRANIVHATQEQAQNTIDRHDAHIDSLIGQLQSQTLNTGQIDALLSDAAASTGQRLQAESLLYGVDPEAAQQTLQRFQEGDDLTERIHKLLDEEGSPIEDDLIAKAISNPAFQQWAEDHGYDALGMVKNGVYLPGKRDELALRHYHTQFQKPAGKYGLVRPGRGQVVAIEVVNENRRPVAQVAVVRSGGQVYLVDEATDTVVTVGPDGRTLSPVAPASAAAVLAEPRENYLFLRGPDGSPDRYASMEEAAELAESGDFGRAGVSEEHSAAVLDARAQPRTEVIIAERAKLHARQLLETPGEVPYIAEDGTIKTAKASSVTVLEDFGDSVPVTQQMVEAVRARRNARLQESGHADVGNAALEEADTVRTVGGVNYRRSVRADPLPSTTIRQVEREEQPTEADADLQSERGNRQGEAEAEAALSAAQEEALTADRAMREARSTGDRAAISQARNAAFIARRKLRIAQRQARQAEAQSARLSAHQEATGHRPMLPEEVDPGTNISAPSTPADGASDAAVSGDLPPRAPAASRVDAGRDAAAAPRAERAAAAGTSFTSADARTAPSPRPVVVSPQGSSSWRLVATGGNRYSMMHLDGDTLRFFDLPRDFDPEAAGPEVLGALVETHEASSRSVPIADIPAPLIPRLREGGLHLPDPAPAAPTDAPAPVEAPTPAPARVPSPPSPPAAAPAARQALVGDEWRQPPSSPTPTPEEGPVQSPFLRQLQRIGERRRKRKAAEVPRGG